MFSSTTPDVLKSLQLPGAARCRCKKTRVNALAQLFVPMIVTAHDQEQMSNATVAFMQAVAFAVAVHDTTMRGEMSAEEFLGTVDQALEIRLKQPGGVELAVLVLRLRDNFRKMVSKTKVLLEDKDD